MEIRVCTKCGVKKELNIDNFYWHKATQKWKTKCKKCQKVHYEENKATILAQNKCYYEENKTTILAQHKEHYEEKKEEILEKTKEYYKENRETILEQKKDYFEENKEKIAEKVKEHYEENKIAILVQHKKYYEENKVSILEQKKIYYEENKETILEKSLERQNNRRKSDPAYRMRVYVSHDIRQGLISRGSPKNAAPSWAYLPYTPQQLADHIESLFESWMTWDNQGTYDPKTWNNDNPATWTWQLDHIIPHSTFVYIDMECTAFQECWAFSNLRPYSAKQNLLDGATKIRHKQGKENK